MNAEPAATSSPQLATCERCGTFADPNFLQVAGVVGGRRLCSACSERLREDRAKLRLYSSRAITWCGVLLNFAVGAILAAIDWYRLGEPRKAWLCAGAAALFVPVFAVNMMANVPTGLMLGLNVGITFAVRQSLKSRLDEHLAAGGPRANVLIPVAITIAVLGAGVAAYVLAVVK